MTEKIESNVLTKDFFVEQIGNLDRKIDGVKQSSKEHLEAVEIRLNKKIDKLDMKIEAVHDNLKMTQGDVSEIKHRLDTMDTKLDRVVEKVERHDEEIVLLKAAG